jgi:hypothetical protein
MKLRLLFILLLLAQTVTARDITVSWEYDFSKDFRCSGMHPNSCVDSFELFYWDDTLQKRVTEWVIPAPLAGASCCSFSGESKSKLPYGTVIYLIAVGRDDKGNRVESEPANDNFTATVHPFPPFHFIDVGEPK